MEIMGVRIRTIVEDNVARRCDGCREIIDGTPWRMNLLDIVAAETPVSWAERPADQPGPVPVPSATPPTSGAGWPRRATCFCRRGEVREIMRPVPIPGETARAGACATASTATITSSSPPDRARSAVDAPSGRFDRRPRGAPILRPTRRYRYPDLPSDLAPPSTVDRSAPRSSEPAGPVDVARSARGPRADRIDRADLAVARSGQPPARRRSRTRCGAGPTRAASTRLHDARRPPRFDRRALERLAAERRPARAGAPGRRPPLASHGRDARSDSRVYRRSYSATDAPADLVRTAVDDDDRAAYRQDGRRLVDRPGRAPRCRSGRPTARARPRPRPTTLVDDLARRLAAAGTSLTESVALFVAARRPFLAELAGLGRRRTLDAARLGALYEDASACSTACCCG